MSKSISLSLVLAACSGGAENTTNNAAENVAVENATNAAENAMNAAENATNAAANVTNAVNASNAM
ncbi:MAG: hypothetical protein V4533_16215 [Pseudomonadota bacterium]